MTPQQVVADLATAARLSPVTRERTWFDVLFEDTADGPALVPDQPDRALLLALADQYAVLGRHLDRLPAAAHLAWLTGVLGVPRLPVVPDRVVAAVTVDPGLAPAVVPQGTLLRGGKDASGGERRYRTIDALTAHGAALAGVRSLTPGGHATGRPGVAASAPDFPLRPLTGPDAPHTLRIHSPALRFGDGDLTARLTFDGAAGASGLAGVLWRCSRADGTTGPLVTGTVSGATVEVELAGGCGAPAGDPWLECVVPAHVPVPVGLSFTAVRVAAERRGVLPDAAFYNDGAVDVTKEFQPFGAVAKRGDAFYLRCDEAFGKSLASLRVSVATLSADGTALSPAVAGTGIPQQHATMIGQHVAQIAGAVTTVTDDIQTRIDEIADLLSGTGEPAVQWQRRGDAGWQAVGTAVGTFTGVAAGPVDVSRSFAVSGQAGHYLRAFLAEGDFGWAQYQSDIATFATAAVKNPSTTPAMPTPPAPPIASGITIDYVTTALPASRVESTSGWRRAVQPPTGAFVPFRRAVSEAGAAGMVAVGLDLPAGALGSTVSLYFEVDSAAPCGATDPVDAAWEWWDGAAWQDLPVADGSQQLRESGLLRFVAPLGWATGCADVSATDGRWVRLATGAPDRLGTVQTVVVDAVLAEFVSAAPDPQLDPSPATALPPGTIKGALAPIRGVKKVTNLASVRGRGPESDTGYRTRASARARHRGRAVTPWDYEQHVALAFPEVAAVLCLPHTDAAGARSPGTVGLVVVPDRRDHPAPLPSASLVARVTRALVDLRPVGADVVVLCPAYAPVTVVATIRLRRGVAALLGQQAVRDALETVLHPTADGPPRWARSLYGSTLVAFLERQPSVDAVTDFELRNAAGTAVEVVEVDRCRGLACSSGAHVLTCEEQL